MNIESYVLGIAKLPFLYSKSYVVCLLVCLDAPFKDHT
jgi:hypothetical protein